jgi:N-acetylglucosaminyl-diphospho-decaprenol L-rhamnosyltransferase
MKTTLVIVTYKCPIIKKCIKYLTRYFKIIIVENSNNIKFKNRLEKFNKNISVILTGENLGYAKSANLGLKKIKSKFGLLINPDVLVNYKTIHKIEVIADQIKNFSILVPLYNGFLDYLHTKIDRLDNQKNTDLIKKNIYKKKIIKIKFTPGFFMFFDMKTLRKVNYFDENFFLYFEDTDLCKKFNILQKKIYLLSNLRIKHYYGKSQHKKLTNMLWLVRNWHFYWSSYYYHKKYYGIRISLILHFSKLMRFLLSAIYFFIIRNNTKYLMNKSRFLGLLNSIILRSSHKGYKLENLNSINLS